MSRLVQDTVLANTLAEHRDVQKWWRQAPMEYVELEWAVLCFLFFWRPTFHGSTLCLFLVYVVRKSVQSSKSVKMRKLRVRFRLTASRFAASQAPSNLERLYRQLFSSAPRGTVRQTHMSTKDTFNFDVLNYATILFD